VAIDLLRDGLSAVDIDGYEVRSEPVIRAGMAGVQVVVDVDADQPSRDWAAIRTLLERSRLEPIVRAGALRAFSALAEAEARAHGASVERVHFHEVGAVDSIVDIVGTSIGLHELDVTELWASPVRVGFGTVRASHGELPIPAPATAQLLHGAPTYAGDFEGEMTTPTGAALLSAFVERYAPLPPVRTIRDGYGAGSRDLPIANLLRFTLAERELGGGALSEVALLETVVDHITPEHLAASLDTLVDAGALDAWATPVQMKKRRLGSEVTVLAEPADAERLTQALMRETGTLGVRRTLTWRSVAARRSETVVTSLGPVRVKVSGAGDSLRVRPENDDVIAIARGAGLPMDVAARTLTSEAERALRDTTGDA
jgi:uncharacterized protein (TIGR00299 family) protein